MLRLLRDPSAHRDNERQALALEAARAGGLPVPAVLGWVTVAGRPGVIMERIEGVDLLTRLGQRPWRVFQIARDCGRLHARIHAVVAPPGLPSAKDAIASGIERARDLPQPLRQFAVGLLTVLPDADRLCHGDFHPGNVIVARGRPYVIDWANAARGDPDGDLARTILLLRLGEPPPGTSAAGRALTQIGRQLFRRAYVRAYRQVRPTEQQRIDQWELVHAAQRLSEAIPGESARLLRLLERGVHLSSRA